MAKNSTFAVEALAGLASTEDFTNVSLKKSSTNQNQNQNQLLVPYKEIMLLLIKGRRHIQTRLIEPVYQNINSGDCFILMTSSNLFHYIGKYSNIIEQTKSSEIIAQIVQNKDLGYRTQTVIIIDENHPGKSKENDVATFWKCLGVQDDNIDELDITKAGHPDEDEVYESSITDTNMVYELAVDHHELVECVDFWRKLPKIEMLDSNKVFVFDFGSELYIWTGKNSLMESKKLAIELSLDIWNDGYDYTDSLVNPLNVASYLGQKVFVQSDMVAKTRPKWALMAKISQHMETVLFCEKFLDWPNFSRIIYENSNRRKSSRSIDIQPIDVNDLKTSCAKLSDLELEGSHLGNLFS